MPKVDATFGPRHELEGPLYLDFVASRPPAMPRSEGAAGAYAAEDRPLHLDPAPREPERKPGTTYHGFAGDPPVAPSPRAPPPVRASRSRRGLLAVGLTALVSLGLAGALWSYAALGRRAAGGGNSPAEPAPAASPGPRPAQVVSVQPLAAARLPAPPDTAALAPSPALRQERLAEPQLQKPREIRRPRTTSTRPEAAAATARANQMAAYAPESTLSAQAGDAATSVIGASHANRADPPPPLTLPSP